MFVNVGRSVQWFLRKREERIVCHKKNVGIPLLGFPQELRSIIVVIPVIIPVIIIPVIMTPVIVIPVIFVCDLNDK